MLRWLSKRTKKPKKEEIDELSYSWTLSVEEVAERLGVNSLEHGLPDDEVERRQGEYGPNALREKGGAKLWKIIFHHLVNIMSFVLFVAFVLAMVTQQWVDAGVVMGIIILNAIIGVSQEWKSEKTMEALKKMSSPSSFVIRKEHPGGIKIPSTEIVPGDIVIISMGDKIPADIRLIVANDLEVDESLLTGESTLVEKIVDVIPEEETPLGDRKNMVFMSSEVKMGKGTGIVVRIGQRTELGKIADSVGSAKKQTTGLEKRMNWMGILLAIVAAIAVGLVLLGLWLYDTEPVYPEGLQVGVTTAVALIPEALVPVITLGLTLGVRRMAKKKALVRKLAALEQLGNVTDICSDKTGTLTQNKMVATNMWLASDISISVTGEGFNPTFGEFLIQNEEDEYPQPRSDADDDDDEDYETDEEATTSTKKKKTDEQDHEMEEIQENELEDEDLPKAKSQVVDKEAIDKPEYHELKTALLISCLCNDSGIYRKRIDTGAQSRKGLRRLLCCFGKKTKGDQDTEKPTDEDVENAIQAAEMENEELGLSPQEGESLLQDGQDDEYTWTFKGTATEAALVTLARKVGFDKMKLTKESLYEHEDQDPAAAEARKDKGKVDDLQNDEKKRKGPKWIQRAEFPFDSTIKLMSVILFDVENARHIVFSKGAPERLIPKCTSFLSKEMEVEPIDESLLERVKDINNKMAYKGLRVLALGYRDFGDSDAWDPFTTNQSDGSSVHPPEREDVEQDLIFVGLVGIKDPPRPGVADAIAICHKAGITVRMVTGDHPSTSAAIARQIGIIGKDDDADSGLVMTSTEFDPLSNEELDQLDEIPLVIARCSPESKVKMVELLHRNKKVTAMTGDGVNDSPAISIADVGIAMGQAGTEVTKEAADIILVDDDFSTIVSAIAEGRRIFANIRKFIVHLLAGNVAEAIVMVVGILSGLRPPIGPLQILWVNLVTGTPPAICLSVEKAGKDLMDKKKRPIGENLFTTLTIVDIFYYGLVMGCLALGAYIAMERELADHKKAQATCYITLTSLLLMHAYNCRRLKKASMFSKSFFTRAWGFHASVLFGLGSAVFTLYTPGLNDTVFHQEDPGYWGWALCGIATILFIFASEGYRIARKYVRKGMVKVRLGREARKAKRLKARRQKAREAKQAARQEEGA